MVFPFSQTIGDGIKTGGLSNLVSVKFAVWLFAALENPTVPDLYKTILPSCRCQHFANIPFVVNSGEDVREERLNVPLSSKGNTSQNRAEFVLI